MVFTICRRNNNNAPNGRKNNNKNNSPLLSGVTKNSTGRVGKKKAVVVQKGKVTKGRGIPTKTVLVQGDVRNKLLAKNRLKIADARDKLAAITKKTTGDLRQKLSSKRPQQLKTKSAAVGLKTQVRGLQGVRPLTGRSPLSRMTIARTVENELARFHVTPELYDLPPPNQYLYQPPYQQQSSSRSYDFVSLSS